MPYRLRKGSSHSNALTTPIPPPCLRHPLFCLHPVHAIISCALDVSSTSHAQRVVLERLDQLTNKAAQRLLQQLADLHQVDYALAMHASRAKRTCPRYRTLPLSGTCYLFS